MALLKNGKVTVTLEKEVDLVEQISDLIVESCDVAPRNPREEGADLLQDLPTPVIEGETLLDDAARISRENSDLEKATDTKIGSFLGEEQTGISSPEKVREFIDNPNITTEDKRGVPTDIISSELTTETRTSNGKRETYIVPDLTGQFLKTFLETNPIIDNSVYSADPFRGRMGLYWSLGEEQKNIEFLYSYDGTKSRSFGSFDRASLRNQISNFAKKNQTGFIEEVFVVKYRKIHFRKDRRTSSDISKALIDTFSYGGLYEGSTRYSDDISIEYTPTFTTGRKFTDFIFDKYLPYTKKELEKTIVPISSVIADISPDYNFYIEQYEDLLKTVEVPENVLPNMYVILSEKLFEDSNPDFQNIMTLGNRIKVSSRGILNSSKMTELDNMKGQYYDLYSRNYKKIPANSIQQIQNKMSNLLVSKNDLDLINKFNDKKELFPMNISVKFSTDNTTKLCGILAETNLTDIFVTKLVNKIIDNSYKTISFIKETWTNVQTSDEANAETRTDVSDSTNRAWNVYQFLEEIEDLGTFEQLNNKKAIYLGEYENKRKSQNNEQNKFINSLNVTIFRNKLTSILESKMRTMAQIYQGKKAYSETVLYRIAKYVGDSAFGDPIQNIFIPNDPDLDILEYIDTQVKYDQNYTYVVYSYDFVIGNEYEYAKVADLYSDITKKMFQTVTTPVPLLIETTLYTKTTSVLDKAPSPPEVQIAAYKDIDNKVLLMLNSSVSQYKGLPVVINDSDIPKFTKQRKYQELETDQLLTFGGDDRVSEFEIYRLDYKPRSYEEFNEKIIKSLSTDYSLTSIQKASSAATIDTIEPNKKYYYIFRSVDVHGNISNPTELLEVEIINENGTIFALFNNVDFEKPNYKTPSRSMKRFIQIMPNIMQSMLDEERIPANVNSAEQIKNNVALGAMPQKIWGKTIKIRLVSKNTKKTIDFKVKFDHKNVNMVEK